MRRRTVRAAAVGVLCILALSVAAATLDAPSMGSGAAGPGAGEGGATTPSRNVTPQNATLTPAPDQQPPALAGEWVADLFCVPALRDPLVQAGLFGLFAGTVVVLVKRRSAELTAVVLAIGFGLPTVFFWQAVRVTLSGCDVREREEAEREIVRNGTGATPGGGAGTGPEAAIATDPQVPVVMLAVVGVALVVALAVLVRGTDDDVVERDAGEDGRALSHPRVVDDIAAAAGAAADRIEASGEVGNEVFRAWREMTEHLDVDRPAASTPGEFHEAAVEAGMSPDDVAELTDLFEAVRYGGAAPTGDREQRAVDALRRIEDAYGGEDGG